MSDQARTKTALAKRRAAPWASLTALLIGAAMLGGCAASGRPPQAAHPSSAEARAAQIQQRDHRLQILERQRRNAQRACDKGDKSQCQRAEILSHEMDGYLVQPW